MSRPKKTRRIGRVLDQGCRENKFTLYGRRGARLARRENAGIFIIFQVFTTQPGAVDRRSGCEVILKAALWTRPAPLVVETQFFLPLFGAG